MMQETAQSCILADPHVCAVMVTFNPSAAVVENVAALAPQVAEIIVVDNGSGADVRPLLERIASQANCRVVYNDKNLGIAAAFNIGIRLVQGAAYSWIALFDQDSRVPDSYCADLLLSLQSYSNEERVGLVSPRLRDPETGLIGSHGSGATEVPIEVVPVTISSGCLIRRDAFTRVGMFAEELFIDYVDHEFALRMRQAGYILLEATAIFLEHRIGATTRHTILGMPVKVTNHPPQRRYYMTRNRLLLYWRYGRRFPAWAINDFICMMKELVGIVLFEEQKIAKLRMMLLGLAHCLTGRRGPLPLHVARGDRSQLP